MGLCYRLGACSLLKVSSSTTSKGIGSAGRSSTAEIYVALDRMYRIHGNRKADFVFHSFSFVLDAHYSTLTALVAVGMCIKVLALSLECLLVGSNSTSLNFVMAEACEHVS